MVVRRQKSGANSRERKANKALDVLGRDRFAAFIRSLDMNGGCRAVDLMQRALAEGSTPDQEFFTGEVCGFHLDVEFKGRDRVRIAFGCQAAPLAGDGGEWTVTFAEDGSVVKVSGGGTWIS